MADEPHRIAHLNPGLSRRLLADMSDLNIVARPDVRARLPVGDIGLVGFPGFVPRPLPIPVGPGPPSAAPPSPPPPPTPPPPEATPPPAPAPAAPAPAEDPPEAPSTNPFDALPFPSPGDRIKAEDFRRLSQALTIVADAYRLAGATFGRRLGEVKIALAAQGYEVARVVSAHGAESAGPDDASLDDRKVVHVAPAALGERRVDVVVTEVAAQPRRQMPNLVGLTYRQAAERIRVDLGDVLAAGGPITVPDLVGRTLGEAERSLS